MLVCGTGICYRGTCSASGCVKNPGCLRPARTLLTILGGGHRPPELREASFSLVNDVIRFQRCLGLVLNESGEARENPVYTTGKEKLGYKQTKSSSLASH